MRRSRAKHSSLIKVKSGPVLSLQDLHTDVASGHSQATNAVVYHPRKIDRHHTIGLSIRPIAVFLTLGCKAYCEAP